eukprot:scpid47581/ scgid0188/ Carbohydrate sulfotransferase 14; Dermatan 4-sulfotransferase 1
MQVIVEVWRRAMFDVSYIPIFRITVNSLFGHHSVAHPQKSCVLVLVVTAVAAAVVNLILIFIFLSLSSSTPGNSLHSATSHVWDYILQEVADKFQFHNSSYSLKPLGHLAMPEIRDRLRAYYKLAVVQHPVHRLVSLYGELSSHLTDNHTLNKLNSSVPATGDNTTQEQDPSWQGMSPERILTEAGNASGNVTYRSVMQFLAKRGPVLTGDDWMPVTDLCQPCVVQYHFIAKVEELPQSAVHALQAIGIADEVTSPVRSEMTTLANTSVVNHLNSELTVKEFYDVQNAYHLDCQLFSYVAKPPAFL